MKIIFEDSAFNLPDSPHHPVHRHIASDREWRRLHVAGAYEDIKAAFVDGAQYRQEYESETIDENGQTVTETMTQDLSEYCVAGDIVDLRDGTFLVYMGKKTDTELMQEALDAVILDALMGGDA